MNVKERREVFPGWPSELDVGRNADNWARLAQEFFCAAIVLNEEFTSVHNRMHSEEQIIMDDHVRSRINTNAPMQYCLGMAIELATKAVLVRDDPEKWIPQGADVKFRRHKTVDFIIEIGLKLSESQLLSIQALSDFVIEGKYPVGLQPSDAVSAKSWGNYQSYYDDVRGVYYQLMKMATREVVQ